MVIKPSPKKLLKYLQERYKDFLVSHNVDVIFTTRKCFEVGGPSFRDNGTFSYIVYPLSNKIEVVEHLWDEDKNDNDGNGINIQSNYFKNIDDWMKFEGYKPSSKKSNPKGNYR